MVVYLDLVMILNCLSDALALYVTARLSAFPLRWKRLLVGAIAGGAYGVVAVLPGFSFLTSCITQMIAAIFLVWFVFGKETAFLRLCLLFYILSCTIGGAMLAISQYMQTDGFVKELKTLDWKVFILVGVICYIVLSIIFRGGVKHTIRDQVCRVHISIDDKKTVLYALHDTGHTLCDPYDGTPVLTVWYQALDLFWTQEEKAVFDKLAIRGSAWCAEELGKISPGKFRLLPYRAVGVECAMLLCVHADAVCIDGERYEKMTLALSPTSVSDGEGYTALWGGERKRKADNVVSDESIIASNSIMAGAYSSK